jgi:hypothetical protein
VGTPANIIELIGGTAWLIGHLSVFKHENQLIQPSERTEST